MVALSREQGWTSRVVWGARGHDMERAWLAILTMAARQAAACALLVTLGLSPVPAQAQQAPQDDHIETYITPFPDNESYRVVVMGDSLADGVWAGLVQAFSDDPQIEVVQKSDGASGITRADATPWDTIVATLAPNEVPHIAIAVFGIADRRSLRVEGQKFEVGSEGWIKEYGRRVDAVLKALKRRGAAVYWIGLPIMRGTNTRRDTEIMNNVFREQALLNNTKFISTWDSFADAAGNYTDFGPDLTGKVRQLREEDGVHLTLQGYEKLAHFAEQEIRRDLAQARSERDVPLAGDSEEQRQVSRQAKIELGRGWGRGQEPRRGRRHPGCKLRHHARRIKEDRDREAGAAGRRRRSLAAFFARPADAGRADARGRSSRRIDGAELDRLGERPDRDGRQGPRAAVPIALLPRPHQGRAVAAQTRPRRRFQLAQDQR